MKFLFTFQERKEKYGEIYQPEIILIFYNEIPNFLIFAINW